MQTFLFPEFTTRKYFQVTPEPELVGACDMGRLPLPLRYYSESQRWRIILPEEVLQRSAETDATRSNLYADYGRTLVHEWDLQPGNAANIFMFIYLHMKKVRMCRHMSASKVSSRAWVLFLYSMRNKTLRGFLMRARWHHIQRIFPAMSSFQPLCNKSLSKTWQMNRSYDHKAWEHIVSACERSII